MTAGVVSRLWLQDGQAWITVGVAEGPDPLALTNYTASVPADAAFRALTPAQQRAALVAAVRAVRAAAVNQTTPPPDLPGVGSTVDV